MENVLDEEIEFAGENLLNGVAWWEKNRRIYNQILIPLQIILVLIYDFSIWDLTFLFYWIILYTIAANLFYCLGWGIEILSYHYFNRTTKGFYRTTLLVLGTLFSIAITCVLYYLEALHLATKPLF